MGGESSTAQYRHAGRRASSALWLTVCCALAAGCAASSSERDAALDGTDTQHVRTDAPDDFFFIRDAPDDFPPPGPPVIRARVTSPQHLTTNLNLMVEVEIAIQKVGDWYGVPAGTAEQSLKQAFALKTLQGAAGVTGTFDISYAMKRMTFSHTAPFAKDTDYVVTMTGNTYVTVDPSRSRSVFHTGSLPRVKLIGFLASKTSPALVDKIIIFFSEGIDHATAIKSVAVKETATGNPLAVSTNASPQLQAYLHVEFKGGHPANKSLDIELGTDVGAPSGKKLDGLYTGVSGSGPLKLTLVPDQHMKDDAWTPSL